MTESIDHEAAAELRQRLARAYCRRKLLMLEAATLDDRRRQLRIDLAEASKELEKLLGETVEPRPMPLFDATPAAAPEGPPPGQPDRTPAGQPAGTVGHPQGARAVPDAAPPLCGLHGGPKRLNTPRVIATADRPDSPDPMEYAAFHRGFDAPFAVVVAIDLADAKEWAAAQKQPVEIRPMGLAPREDLREPATSEDATAAAPPRRPRKAEREKARAAAERADRLEDGRKALKRAMHAQDRAGHRIVTIRPAEGETPGQAVARIAARKGLGR